MINSPRFQKATLDQYPQVMQWLAEPHVKEFWDNSPEHKQDILIYMNGRKETSPYWDGIFDYWIGFIDDEPYCLLMTSDIDQEASDLPEIWKAHISKTGKTVTIDFMIGNMKYLGKGVGGTTLDAFTRFIHQGDPMIDTFLIDPVDTNPRAKHVYEKGGFHTVGTFVRDFVDKKNVRHFLMVKKFQ
jgi:RimJ/RimL family protein N-acetyltransferase